MNSRWFYILLANITLLIVNIWFFTGKSQSITKVPAVSQSITEPALLKLDPLSRLGISSIESFHFPLMRIFPTDQADFKSQLIASQQRFDKQKAEMQRDLQKSTLQLATLKKRNNILQHQVALLDQKLIRHNNIISTQKRNIARLFHLEKVQPLLPVLQTDVDHVKELISSQPDLIKAKGARKLLIQSSKLGQISLVNGVDVKHFSGSIEFGFLYEQDNQVTKSIDGRMILDYNEVDKYNINSDLDFEFESEDDEMSTKQYRWQLQSDYNLDPTNLVFARSDLNRSKFSSYKKEDVFTVGYGRILLNTIRHKFNTEIAPGYRFAVPNAGENAVSVDEFIIRTGLNYERVLSDTLQVKMDSVLEKGHSNSVYSMGFQAQNKIYQELYLTFNFKYKFTQNVPVDTVNEEVSSGLSLLYAF